MHKKYRIPSLVLFGCIFSVTAAVQSTAARADNPKSELRVEVTGLKSSRGDVIFALYNSSKTFTKQAYKTAFVHINNDKCEWVLKGLPHGDYAIVLVHDENGNHDMDNNLLGLPKEPYAFSNNVKPRLSAPPFHDAKFSVGRGETIVQIELE